MRKVVLICVLALALPAAALARPHDKGDGSLVVKNASAKIAITSGKGFIGGRLDDGTLYVYDLNPLDSRDPEVFNAAKTVQKSPTLTVYQGTNLRFRFVAPHYAVRLAGSGIDLTAVGQGKVTIDGAGTTDDGQFSVDGDPFESVGPTVDTPFSGSFGQLGTATTSTTTTTTTTSGSGSGAGSGSGPGS